MRILYFFDFQVNYVLGWWFHFRNESHLMAYLLGGSAHIYIYIFNVPPINHWLTMRVVPSRVAGLDLENLYAMEVAPSLLPNKKQNKFKERWCMSKILSLSFPPSRPQHFLSPAPKQTCDKRIGDKCGRRRGGSWGIMNMDMGVHLYGGYGGIWLHGWTQNIPDLVPLH